MKKEEREKARSLRISGWSIRRIADRLHVAKSSVSRWVRDIELTQDQLNLLTKRSRSQYLIGSHAYSARCAEKREKAKLEGMEKARQHDALHALGCALYWGEGGKSQRHIAFSNADPNMIRVFIHFLQKSLFIPTEKIIYSIQCYDDLHTVKEIEAYWMKVTNLPKQNIRKTTINKVSPYSQRKRAGKLEWGTCRISVYSVEAFFHISGAVEEYGSLCKP